ncbi:general transcription factor II-I repeat domain-containing protein 2A [Trichonephila clavipes]|nr:general transcription factor II-I repeat domain-containing protein 2A [Trichonephila clavipes]
MASSTTTKKVQDSKCSKEFQTWWAEKYGMITIKATKRCVFYVLEQCAATYSAANAITRHGKPFQEGEFLKEAWLACVPSLFDDFDNKDKIIQRIKDVPLSRNTKKDRILKLAENVTDQQKNDINSAPFISLCLDESTKSAHLAVFARYCVGNIIMEELIAITSLLTTTKGTDICTAVCQLTVRATHSWQQPVACTVSTLASGAHVQKSALFLGDPYQEEVSLQRICHLLKPVKIDCAVSAKTETADHDSGEIVSADSAEDESTNQDLAEIELDNSTETA